MSRGRAWCPPFGAGTRTVALSGRGDDGDRVVEVGGVDGLGCRVDGDDVGRAADREPWLGAVAAGGDGGVTGGGVDDRDAGVFDVGDGDGVVGGSKATAVGPKPTVTAGGVCPHPVVVAALQVAPLITDTVPDPSPFCRSAT